MREAMGLISNGTFGSPLVARLPLVVALHDLIVGQLAGGASQRSARRSLETVRRFFAWADRSDLKMTLASVSGDLVDWSEHLLQRQRLKTLKPVTVYGQVTLMGALLDEVLNENAGSAIRRTRVRRTPQRKRALGTQADKQNLVETYAFGHALLDITSALSKNAVYGPLPVRIAFRTGQTLDEWLHLKPPEKTITLGSDRYPSSAKERLRNQRKAFEADARLAKRHALVNLRIDAELLIFIAQTGMNVSQATRLKASKFRYQSHLDGYQVRRVYKGRRQGEVEFEVYSAYRSHFEDYLAWRHEMFPDDSQGLLFPHVAPLNKPKRSVFNFTLIQKRLAAIGVPYISPRRTRNTRVNWLLRRSQDPSLTAEMSQHTKETLLGVYEQAHHQVAVIEVSRFFSKTDPAISASGPGACVSKDPTPIPDIPPSAPQPDCISSAGCLFCMYQRDIDSPDHVWSLCTFRYLKSLELAKYRPAVKERPVHPAEAAIFRLDAKLRAFEESSSVRAHWVAEALAKVAEENYHERWAGFISLTQMSRQA